MERWVSIATKAYQQAVKYKNIYVSDDQRQQLFYFIHDWWRMIEDENNAIESGEETPSEMFQKFMKGIKDV